jgi:hypothetical protein
MQLGLEAAQAGRSAREAEGGPRPLAWPEPLEGHLTVSGVMTHLYPNTHRSVPDDSRLCTWGATAALEKWRAIAVS